MNEWIDQPNVSGWWWFYGIMKGRGKAQMMLVCVDIEDDGSTLVSGMPPAIFPVKNYVGQWTRLVPPMQPSNKENGE